MAIAPVSINARGVLVTLASDPGTLTIDQAETVVRTGYTAAGGTTPTTWEEPIVFRSRARTAGTQPPSTTFRATEYVLSKVVLLGDTILGYGGATNFSTRVAPLIEHRWAMRNHYTVDASDTAIAAFGTSSNRNGTPIAFVVFKWEDSALSSVTTTVTAPSKRPCPLTGLVGQVYEGTTPAGFSSLLDGQIRKTYTAYGHYGQVVTSDVTPTSWYGAEPYPHFIRKKTGFQPVYIYFKSTGVTTGGAASTSRATAAANPWALTTTAYNNSRDAAITANNSANGINALDGAVYVLMGDGTGTADIGAWPITGAASKNCFIGGITIEADPAEYTSYTPSVTMDGFNIRLVGSTTGSTGQGILVQNLKVQRQSGSSLNTMVGLSGNIYNVTFKNGAYDAANVTSSVWPVSLGTVLFEDMTFTGSTSGSGAHFLGTTTTFFRGWIGCLNTAGMNSKQVAMSYGMGSILTNVRVLVFFTPTLLSGQLVDACFFPSCLVTGSNVYLSADTNATATRGHIYRNMLIEMLNAAENNRTGGFSQDAATNNLNTVAFHGCAFPGSVGDGSGAGANRSNIAYLDTLNDPRVHSHVNFVGTLPPMFANKGDKFVGMTATNYDGWSDLGNGVGSAGNFLTRIQPSDSFNPDYYGMGSAQPATGATETLPGYTNPQVPTVMNGSNGTGGGDYTFIDGAAAIGSVSYVPEMLWDAMGNDLPAGVVQTTPGPYAGLYYDAGGGDGSTRRRGIWLGFGFRR
jgi:hypothetical protein